MVVLTNYGNTCYFNVILQIFIHTCGNPKRNEWKAVLNGLRELKIDTEFKPNLIHKYLKLTNLFKVGYPHDAHEAFLHIIDFLDDTSFKGNILHKIVTKGVPLEVNKNKEEFTSIELALVSYNLEENIDEFFKYELINGWKDKYGNKRDIIKSVSILNFPNNLVIVLKQLQHRKKKINFPDKLNMTKYASNTNNEEIYKLISVIIHSSCHYYGYYKEKVNWYLYNDEYVRRVAGVPREHCPYMLIYTKLK